MDDWGIQNLFWQVTASRDLSCEGQIASKRAVLIACRGTWSGLTHVGVPSPRRMCAPLSITIANEPSTEFILREVEFCMSELKYWLCVHMKICLYSSLCLLSQDSNGFTESLFPLYVTPLPGIGKN